MNRQILRDEEEKAKVQRVRFVAAPVPPLAPYLAAHTLPAPRAATFLHLGDNLARVHACAWCRVGPGESVCVGPPRRDCGKGTKRIANAGTSQRCGGCTLCHTVREQCPCGRFFKRVPCLVCVHAACACVMLCVRVCCDVVCAWGLPRNWPGCPSGCQRSTSSCNARCRPATSSTRPSWRQRQRT